MIKMTSKITGASKWYANLSITLNNQSPDTLINPKISVQLAQPATVTPNTGYTFTQTGNTLNGILDGWMLPVAKNTQVTFSVGLNFPDGNNNNLLPAAFWVNGILINPETTDTVPPSSPRNLSASGVTESGMTLSWSPSTDNVRVDHYVVSCSDGSSVSALQSSTTSVSLNNLKAGTSYTLLVLAVDGSGNSSPPSPPLVVKTTSSQDVTPPTLPGNLRTTSVTATGIGLTWSPSVDNSGIAEYRISYTSVADSGEKSTPDTSCMLSNLLPDTPYRLSVQAVDTSGNMSGAAIITVTTAALPDVPATAYTPFIDVTVNATWDDWQNYPAGRPGTGYSRDAINWGTDGLIFGFITLSPDNTPCWAAQSSMPVGWAKPLADEINAAGLRTYVSFGGASNADISTTFTVEKLITTYIDTIDSLGASGLDFDLENGLYNINAIVHALATVQSIRPAARISFTLPVMPYGLTTTGMKLLQTARDNNINFVVNGMAMDYYDPAYSSSMGQAAVDAATSIMKQVKSLYPSLTDEQCYAKVGVTPMLGLNDDLSMFTLEDAKQLSAFARKHNLCFVSEWSLNRDNPSSYAYVDVGSSSNPQQNQSGEYALNMKM